MEAKKPMVILLVRHDGEVERIGPRAVLAAASAGLIAGLVKG